MVRVKYNEDPGQTAMSTHDVNLCYLHIMSVLKTVFLMTKFINDMFKYFSDMYYILKRKT